MTGVTTELENRPNPSNKCRFTYFDKMTKNNVNIPSAYDLLQYFLPVYFWTHLLRSSQCFLSESIFRRDKECNNFCFHGSSVDNLHGIRLGSREEKKSPFCHNTERFSYRQQQTLLKICFKPDRTIFFPTQWTLPGHKSISCKDLFHLPTLIHNFFIH